MTVLNILSKNILKGTLFLAGITVVTASGDLSDLLVDEKTWTRSPTSGNFGSFKRSSDNRLVMELRSHDEMIAPTWRFANCDIVAGKVYLYQILAKAPLGTKFRVYIENPGPAEWEHFEEGMHEGNGEWQTVSGTFSRKEGNRAPEIVVTLLPPGNLEISEAKISEADPPDDSHRAAAAEAVSFGNGDFENGEIDWELSRETEIIADPQDNKNHVLRLTVPVVDNLVTAEHRPVPVEGGTKYLLTYRVRGVLGKGDSNAFHWFRVYPVGNVSSFPELQEFSSSFDQWQEKNIVFTTSGKDDMVHVVIEARGPAEVLFDDLRIERIAETTLPAQIQLDYPFSYRDGVFASDRTEEFSGTIQWNSANARKAKLEYKDADGKLIGTAEIIRDQSADTYSFPAPPVGSSSLLKLIVFDKEQQIVGEDTKTIHSYAPAPSEVVLTRQKFALVNGKRFFPIGHTWTSSRGSLEFELSFFKEAGFNCLMMKGIDKTLDVFARHGMMLIKELPKALGGRDNAEENSYAREMFLQELASVRQHRALLGYFGADEPGWIGYDLEKMREVYELIRRNDPYHPVWVNEAPVITAMDNLRQYASIADIYGVDIYPVPEGSKHGSLESNRTISCVGDYVDICRSITDDRKPIWMVLQAFSWNQCHNPLLPPEKAEYPTWEQSRFMAYNAITHGATGIIYHYLPYAKVLGEEFWKDLRKVTLELSYLSPVLVEDSVSPPQLQSDNAHIRIMQKSHQGHSYYIVVNESDKPVKTELFGFGDQEKTLNVLLEERKKLHPVGGSVSVLLPAYGVLVLSSAPFASNQEIYHDETLRPYGEPVPFIGSDEPPPLNLESAISRKWHGHAGYYDLPLPLKGPSGIEPRLGGNCELVLTFNKEVIAGFVEIAGGEANLAKPSAFSGCDMTVQLENVRDRQKVTLALVDILSADATVYSGSLSIRILAGDANRNGAVTSVDFNQVGRSQSNPVSPENFPDDIDTNGEITAADLSVIHKAFGRSVAP